ncbi:MAG: hypothetical protein WD598_03290 [Acidimicrobiia bacterium]
MSALVDIRDGLQEYSATLDADCYAGADAVSCAQVSADIVKIAQTITMLHAKRAVDTGAWRNASHAVSPEQWFANVTGTSEHAARETLTTADRLVDLPTTAEKLRAGEVSLAQAAQVTAAASVDPASEGRMLRATKRGFRELRAAKERVVTAASDEDRLRKIARDERHLAGWARGFATHGSFSGPTEEVTDLFEALEPLARAAFEAARKTGEHQPLAAYRFDALVALARGAQVPASTKPVVRVRVGLDKLLDRPADGVEDVCEIPGVGPVPVDYAREVLSHGLLELVITDGVDVQSVVSTTRHVPKALKIAIDERDGGVCKIRDCDHTRATERHHTLGYADNRITSYRVLGDVCPEHHDLITHRGYEVIDNTDSTWSLRAPPHSSAA